MWKKTGTTKSIAYTLEKSRIQTCFVVWGAFWVVFCLCVCVLVGLVEFCFVRFIFVYFIYFNPQVETELHFHLV